MRNETLCFKCPNCDGDLTIEDGLDIFYCKYCGHKIILEGQSDAAYHAKTEIKEMEHDERMADKKYAHERYKIESKNKVEFSKKKISVLIGTVVVLFYIAYFAGAKISLDKQEVALIW